MDYRQEQLSLLMNHTQDAVWLVNTALQTLDINPAACRLLGWQAKKIIGQPCSAIWPENTASGHRELGKYLEQAMIKAGTCSFNQGHPLILENGRMLLVEGVTYPLLSGGKVIGAAAIFRQVSPERDVEQMQADFISMASHNLRTPLMSIQAVLDYVLETRGDPQKNRQLLSEARSQSQKIGLFLRRFLDASQLVLGRETTLKLEPVNFLLLVQSIVAEYENTTADITFELEVPHVLPRVSTDKTKAAIILQNLITHAKGRSNAGDSLRVVVAEQEEDIVVSILDNGTPIPPQQYQRIFWQVYSLEVDKNNGAMPYGYGIGLYNTRRLAELLGGNIWVSQSNTNGISLNFTLPIWR